MDNFIAFVAGAGIALWLRRAWVKAGVPNPFRRDDRTGPVPVAPTEDVVPARSAASRLSDLIPDLTAAGDASAHPRDLTGNKTFMAAIGILGAPSTPVSVAIDYATGANYMLAAAALAALTVRADRDEAAAAIVRHFPNVYPWPAFYALQYFTKIQDRPAVGPLLIRCPEYWAAHPLLPAMFAEHFSARQAIGDTPTFLDALFTVPQDAITRVENLLRAIDHPWAHTLLADVATFRREALDRGFLESFGRFIHYDSEQQLVIEHAGIAAQLATAEAAALQPPFRSVLVVGEPRSGKTAFVRLLAGRAMARGWSVFEAGAASLMAGQQYFGQLEERLRRLTQELSVEKTVLWYAPEFLQLAASGTHSGQAASVLDQVLPAIAAGKIVLVSETTPSALTTILQKRPALRSAMELVRLPQPNDDEVDAIARAFGERLSAIARIAIDESVVETATHVARHYMGTAQMPGAALDLLKLTAQRAIAHDAARVERGDVLAALSQLTGMPQLILDDRERVDLAAVRQFFTSRVIGQDEAVDALVDRIAMLKAGLTDPGKPIGVFLFAGPTGTGKTELAKSLAQFLFGSEDRMIRLDMSEFQTAESTRKILGEPDQQSAESPSLTQRIRKQPFSVVLLDEFEKAHPNTWDLFLQVFDDGRLTDAHGQTVDFRHSIIILTSNLGAKIAAGPGLGFVSQAGGFSQDHVLRAVHQSFRPEFVNRLDAIIVFRALTRELMRGILAKELSRVLERRGLRDREWAVEWESSALEFLLDKGFSPTMGARPLKRAIDRYLLAPLAATLVEHRVPEGDQFLFVRSDGRGIQVEFVDPDAPVVEPEHDRQPVPATGSMLVPLILQPAGVRAERDALASSLQAIEKRLESAEWAALEEQLSHEMQQAGFWNAPGRFKTLARYALMDRVKAAIGTAQGLLARLDRGGARDTFSRDLLSRLASQLYVLRHGVRDAMAGAAVEVALSVQPVLDRGRETGAGVQWAERLVGMYRKWAANRHMQFDDVSPATATTPAIAVISGFGAARMLAGEPGLHLLEYEGADEEIDRAVARVRLAPTPDEIPDAPPEKHRVLLAALNAGPPPDGVVRRYRLDSAPLVRDVANGWRTGRADLVMGGHFDLFGETT
jgi:ATP-dependent Clp protease ATP-binding subunit ClpC